MAAKTRNFFSAWSTIVDLRALVHEINLDAAKIARRAADRVANETGSRDLLAGQWVLFPLPLPFRRT